jgi:hypothetical protein
MEGVRVMSKQKIRIVMAAPKARNLVARELVCNANFKPRTVRDRTRYTRKGRAKGSWD